ncbi:SbcC family exonuclease [Lacticaseibacillus daqingensis]|uniref:SbcC family exonuclease n=1 Tax=Lacticaseibacillus daqingensis TaxID=2486014 RepID=UPI000F789D94|nr:SbcC family exonuclease [Lacticaseibacillus daqingensis]
MTIQSSLTYQKKFFDAFDTAWQNRSTFRLYQGIDTTAANLRLALSETPGYILAYDKDAQRELHDFLQTDFIAFLREHIPFFKVSDGGDVFFGDWYHRRQFGHIDVISRLINQTTDAEAAILPQLQAFAQDPDNFLDNQIEAMRQSTYAAVDDLHNQMEAAAAESASEPARASTGTGSGLRGMLKSFIDPSDEPAPSKPARRNAAQPANKLKARFDAAKEAADAEFDANKRQLEVAAAITRYEYQAVTAAYSSVDQFQNVLANLSKDFMKAQEAKEAKANA